MNAECVRIHAALDSLIALAREVGARFDANARPAVGHDDALALNNGWLRVLVDLSFAVEEALTSSTSSSVSTMSRFCELIALVDEPSKAFAERAVDDGPSLVAMLGEDDAELLRWRAGSIRYAAVSTLLALPTDRVVDEAAEVARCQRAASDEPRFVGLLEDGARLLYELLVRAGARFTDGASTEQDESTPDLAATALLRAGIRSSAHVLALMFTADLLFWRHCCGGHAVNNAARAEELPIAAAAVLPVELFEHGQSWRHGSLKCARAYVHIVSALLPPCDGWERARADELIRRLQG